ncbi:MAG: hypothetical protein JO189_14120 [Deltaproteobacteria bacterium]|nr:hypothetical protein [Deltaproteobacteria bacterium]
MKNLGEAISGSTFLKAPKAAHEHSLCRVEIAENAKTLSASERVVEAVRNIVGEEFQPGMRALILTGSLARDEATWLHEKGRQRLAGDVELIAVFSEHDRLPSAGSIAALKRAVDKWLHESGLEVHIGLSPVRPRYLRSLKPHIFAYELLEHGRVIWGDKNILSLAPQFSPVDIPLEDGFRLLMNRIIELLEALCTSQPGMLTPRIYSELVHYRSIKLWIDMATSFLLFQGQYEPTYRRRADKLAQMASSAQAYSDGVADAPILLDRFTRQVSLATDYKLGKTKGIGTISLKNLRSLIVDAHSIWRWELRRLTGSDDGADDNEMLKRWLKSQVISGRIRGWAATAKRYGLRRSTRMLPRWVRLGLKGSPRRLVYAVASQLFFAMNSTLPDKNDSGSGTGLKASLAIGELPVVTNSGTENSWRGIGQAMAWNYHQFLESTRS